MTGFWIAAAVLVLVAPGLLLRALLRPDAGHFAREAAFDLAVHRDQLREVERDAARGLIGSDEAAALRAELGRRVLDADRRANTDGTVAAPPGRHDWLLGGGVAALIACGTVALYVQIGAPGYADLPLADRRPSQAVAEERIGGNGPLPAGATADYLALVAQLRAVVATRPDDAAGLGLLAQHEAALDQYLPARAAQGRRVTLLGDAATAADWSFLAELLIVAAGGYVSPQGEAALSTALSKDPEDGRARYYAGRLYWQQGRPDLTVALWNRLLAEGPADAPWRPFIEANLPAVQAQARIATGAVPEDTTERAEMIRGMVEALAARLEAEGGSAEEWVRLVRALSVLGEPARADAAAATARAQFGDDPAILAEIAAARAAGAE